MQDKWKLFWSWVVIVSLLLLSECAPAPTTTISSTYELIEPLGTKHLYKKEPLVGKSYYCINHEAPEIIYELDGSKRVRRWSGHDWRN
jgi:hypothetical protein|tara:strand:- start:5511 stop:5774 length:264 start_codon:yes stop_codon:yes gene_type:complete